jgi:hypothetical protein
LAQSKKKVKTKIVALLLLVSIVIADLIYFIFHKHVFPDTTREIIKFILSSMAIFGLTMVLYLLIAIFIESESKSRTEDKTTLD